MTTKGSYPSENGSLDIYRIAVHSASKRSHKTCSSHRCVSLLSVGKVFWPPIYEWSKFFYFLIPKREVASDKWASKAILGGVFIKVWYTLNGVPYRLKCWYDIIFIMKQERWVFFIRMKLFMSYFQDYEIYRKCHWGVKEFDPIKFSTNGMHHY